MRLEGVGSPEGTVIVKFTVATEEVTDLDLYPKASAWDTIEDLNWDVLINDSFNAKLATNPLKWVL